ncbi:hypothetical protein [Aquimarina brevivitae]|uniref:SpoIIAA-like protein n=1 Tax=Aquimarina brevivitae TaxID=323412 RepID=A0A4Q7NVL8_9FLAO|nr:hypothetical protein [Aquimarina brevivitae]RZS90452.1 hypothetical protein EV197_3438 [Aquimarina brevivitae]
MAEFFDLGFTQVEVHEDYILNTIEEGYHITLEDNTILFEFAKEFFNNKPFVYIANRVNSYSVDPTVYMETARIESLLGVAVVSQQSTQKRQVKLEQTFYKGKLAYFDTLDKAIAWKNKLVAKKKNNT